MDERPSEEGWPDEEFWTEGEGDRSTADTASLVLGALAHAFQKAGPETTGHLVSAGRELMLAVRSFVQHFAEAMTSPSEGEPHSHVEHIPIEGAPTPPRPEPAPPVADQPKPKSKPKPKPKPPGRKPPNR